jgi:5-methyltetrahydropteroyltriglutamate--homocysteine methyltransferase
MQQRRQTAWLAPESQALRQGVYGSRGSSQKREMNMAIASNLGLPRIGARRELKRALEDHWSGKLDEAGLLSVGQSLRREHWLLQKRLGIVHIPSNDFSFYDHVLDTTAMVGAVPSRYGWSQHSVDLRTYFAMARGSEAPQTGETNRRAAMLGVPAMEMTKWFDTNYHYIVPEFTRGQRFCLASTKPADEFVEAKALGVHTRPVMLGPVSFLLLGKTKDAGLERLSLLDSLLPVYEQTFERLAEAGADWIQIDEPLLALDIEPDTRTAFSSVYQRLARISNRLRLLVATYFEGLRENLSVAMELPIAALHLDLVRAPEQLDEALAMAPSSLMLSLGVIDGRNIWRTNLQRALSLVERAAKTLGPERVLVAPSCSLLHSPVDVDLETRLDTELRGWLAFAKQKLEEVVLLTRAVNEGPEAIRKALDSNHAEMASRASSTRIHNPDVKRRSAQCTPAMLSRTSPYPVRRNLQAESLQLPMFPTTTIGSFPQTPQIRAARAEFKARKRDLADYEAFLRAETEKAIRFQEEIGLDVLVHGEFERNDMVEFFGEQLSGFMATENGWVQSYGSRCVKPPIIYGDVARLRPMTVEWSRFAQSLTPRPMKGMLTGPVTILQWSFVRDDQPRSETCKQIALAIRDEVIDLENAGIRVIQIDEPAVREGLPLRHADWNSYLQWAVEAFRLASSGVLDETQIHTHMCYAEFNDIIHAVGEMDADVISIETSRSQMELLNAFTQYRYPNGIGPGVYDIHSPRVPDQQEIEDLLRKALCVLAPSQLWVNPDCGLKTRRWEEVRPALTAMVQAARKLRESQDGNSKHLR